jgi:hypothetical protein
MARSARRWLASSVPFATARSKATDRRSPSSSGSGSSVPASARKVGTSAAMTNGPQQSGPGGVIGGPTTATWREHALTRIAENRFLTSALLDHPDGNNAIAAQTVTAIMGHLDAAKEAVEDPRRGWWAKTRSALAGASVERATSHLDAAETDLLRAAPDAYLRGQLPSVKVLVETHLPPDDARRIRVEEIAERIGQGDVGDDDRNAVLAAVRAASSEARRKVRRVRSFRNVLLMTALFLALGAGGMATIGILSPATVPLCFNPEGEIVCPTHDSPVRGQEASGGGAGRAAPSGPQSAAQVEEIDEVTGKTVSSWDLPIVELVGLIAAAVAAAAALRSVRGTSTPYSLPIALAVLKLPTGALTAVLGLLLMRGEFIPGLTALDSSAQIISWAIVFGYAQQLLTQFVDRQAQGVLEDVGGATDQGSQQQRDAA